MEPVERRLTHHATSIAQTNALEVMQIERELEDLKAQITVLEAKANTGRLALDLLDRYEPKSQTTYDWPWCWIEFERKQRLGDAGRKFLKPASIAEPDGPVRD